MKQGGRGAGTVPVEQLVDIVRRQRQQEFAFGNQNFGLARRIFREVLVEHFVDKVADLDIASN
jgi:hypothetical protein